VRSDVLQLLTGYGELMLAEFKYGLVPKESFSQYVDQSKSNRYVVNSVLVEWVLITSSDFSII
jgi:hypothetical protein